MPTSPRRKCLFNHNTAVNPTAVRADVGSPPTAPFQNIFIVRGAAPQTIYQPAPRGEKLLLTKFTQSVCRAVDYPNFKNTRVIEKLESYAATDKKFSGFIRYETTFPCPVKTLEITQAYEGVEAFVNGQSAGIQVTAPFVYDLRDLVKPGENRLVIEVVTTLERERGNTKTAAPTGIMICSLYERQ